MTDNIAQKNSDKKNSPLEGESKLLYSFGGGSDADKISINYREKKALILLSGGLDSATVAYFAKNKGYELFAISFDYGQKHKIELESVKKIIDLLEIKKSITINLDPEVFNSSSLTNKDINIDDFSENKTEEIPATYVPARNTLFLSYALAFAESHNILNIFIGANQVDYSGYPDCRPEFIESFEKMANLGTKFGVEGKKIKIETPLIDLTKAEIITLGTELGLDYSITHSCYNPSNKLACGKCDSCIYRKKGFLEANIEDPTKYVS